MELINLQVPDCSGLSVAVEATRDAVARPCMLEVRAEAVVFLGALCDPAGAAREWVEIRVQEIAGIEGMLDASAGSLTNPVLDARWKRMVDGHARSDREALFRGPWEQVHGEPWFLNAAGTERVRPPGNWQLCLDDDLLARHRLATFSESFHRYLVSKDGGEEIFVPLTEGASRSPSTREFGEIFKDLQVLNREGGLLMIRRLPGLKFEDFVDFLGGKDFGGDPHELLRVPAVGPYKGFVEKNAYGQAGVGFIHGRTNVPERVAEILFLKLTALRGAFDSVSDAIAAQKLPFLSLRGESFSVSITDPAPGLPFLWNHRVHQSAVSTVVPVALGVGNEEMLLPCVDVPRSVYRAERLAAATEGQARVRVRKITPPDDGGLSVIEGTLQTDESLQASRKDLLELDLRLAKGKRFKVYGNFVAQRPTAGENRFLSLPLAVPPDVIEELERGGMQFSERVDFRVLPRLGATCDLFSMGILAVRTLLCGPNRLLAELVDDLLGLVHAYGGTFEASEWDTGSGQLAGFIASDKGAAWRDKLGSICIAEGISAEDAAAAIPNQLWWQIVEFIGRLFPGEMPGAFAKDFDDFEARAPERVFAEPIEALDGLVQAARSLLFGNPVASREILTVIRGLAAKHRA
ncbi:MAG: hypothetical protein JWO82_3040 [Akkermansiaceae bacterium]|nr:hypothetical protein [Akkermansiaceae bacterium]